jgi:hypothetical protein
MLMTGRRTVSRIDRIFCADWGKEERKRAVYEVVVPERLVRRVARDVRTVAALLGYASGLGESALVTFDAPIGVPESFIDAVRRTLWGHRVRGFLDWLDLASLERCTSADDWSLVTPFFKVPRGKGSLKRFEETAGRHGVDLRRRIELQTGGKPAFVTGGIPGSVGSAARDIWKGLVAARRQGAQFQVWPFEVPAVDLVENDVLIVAEIYPRAAYATALIDVTPRPRMSVSKTKAAVRRRAIDALLAARWVGANEARFENVDEARANEDDFDALMTAAALLRCRLEALPMWSSPLCSPASEGGILGTGSVDLTLQEKKFG